MWYQYIVLFGYLALGFLFVCKLIRAIFKIYLTLQGPFFAQSSEERIKQIVKLANLKPGMKVVDLGSGDGRVLIAMVKAEPKIKAIGYEIDPKLIRISRRKIKEAGLEKQITINQKSLWKADLSDVDVIVFYFIKHAMYRLKSKLLADAPNKAKIISVYFQLPDWKPEKKLGDIRLYRKNQAN